MATNNPEHTNRKKDLKVFCFQKVSNYGTETPAVARTFLQGCEILEFFEITNTQKDGVKEVLYELQRHLIRCVETRDQIASEVDSGHESVKKNGFSFQSGGRSVQLPGVAELHSRAEAFLQAAKLAISETAHLIEPFYGVRHDHRYHKFAAWAGQQFGEDDFLVRSLRDWEPWVKSIVDMRNAVDHPSDGPGGRLVTHDFRVTESSGAPILIDPVWCLAGSPECSMIADMDAIIEGTLSLGETILCAMFYKFKIRFPLVLEDIPVEKRNPSCPMRLRVQLAEPLRGAKPSR